MKNVPYVYRITRDVQVTQVVTHDLTDVDLYDTLAYGHDQADPVKIGPIIKIEKIAIPDQTTLEQSRHIQVEYILPDMSREYDTKEVSIPLPLIKCLGSVEAAFEFWTEQHRNTICYYDENLSDHYTHDGTPWEEKKETQTDE